uniref:BED-type domain-containing protein n=1 Tax=Meloidogyne floridensis TaxID=298350 RepID=A0A915P5W0_9BILA
MPMSIKRSSLWNHFIDISGNNVICKHCSEHIKRGSALSHVRNSHNDIYEQNRQAVLEHFTKIDNGRDQGKLRCHHCRRKFDDHIHALTMHCLSHGINFVNPEQKNTEINVIQLEEQARKELIANTIQGLFGDDNIPTDVVPASQGYVHHDPSFYDAQYELDTQKAIEESGREMPRGRGGPLIRDQGEQSAKGKEKVIEVSSDSD